MENTLKNKICSICKHNKNIIEFSKCKSFKDGHDYQCRKCKKLIIKKQRRTRLGLTRSQYDNMRQRSKKKNYIALDFTIKEFREWVFRQDYFEHLYIIWGNSGYIKSLVPSVDRINNNIGYTLKNMQLMSWKENDNKGSADHKSGVIKYDQTPVIQYSLNNEYINRFISQAEASRKTGVRQATISNTCLGKQRTSGGYKWEFDKRVENEKSI